ncbi:MAG: hypothetical protein DRI97_04150 [Bacteroidetes bacterium]|nr:MAG: hypothetical protein DRI97_04150 [Bacteroidota bacterium]
MNDHKLAAIVFTDIVGYTKRMDADEEGTMKLLARQREILFPMVKEFGGEVIKEIGDGLLMMFTSANRAVRFSMAVQEKLEDDELTIRAGIHIGDVIFEEGDVFGSAVNIAARIEPLAPAGGICISEDVRNQIRNQGDILTTSIGKKELKGVAQAVEIFQVVKEISEESHEKVPFFKDLWQRRVIQITGIYLLMSYLLKLGIGFMVKEYMLSPHLTNLIWYILLSLVPSIILIAYFHGRKGVSKWTRIELIGLPINIIAAVLVLFIVFQGKDLGAITTKLTVENEKGEKIEKLVVKNEFRKSVFIFNMETTSTDTNLIYLQYSIPAMLKYDLAQDLFISPETSLVDFAKMIEAGYERGVGLPVTLMKRMAEERHMKYFVGGHLEKEDNELVLTASLYETRLTKKISEFTVRSTDPFSLIDKISEELKRGMSLPESHISETVDLPVSAIFTDSEKALYFFSRAMRAELEKNWEDQLLYLNIALQEDPDFALAYVIIAISYFKNNEFESTMEALQAARKLEHKLPERQQFTVKYVYYVLDQQPEKAIAVVKMWAEMFPDDLEAHNTLAQRYAVRNMHEEAIGEIKVILRLDPEKYDMLKSLAEYYQQIGEYDSALVYFQKYAMNLPQQAESYENLGDFYRLSGEMELAKQNYEKAILLADASEEHSIKADLAYVHLYSGDFDEAYKGIIDVLESAGNNTDSIRAYRGLQSYYLITGQVQKSLEYYVLKMEIMSRILAPKDFMVYRVMTIEPYIHAGKFDEAVLILEDTRDKLDAPVDKIVPFGYLYIYAETGDTTKSREAISEVVELMEGFGEEIMRINVYKAEARIHEYGGAYEKAIEKYSKCLEIQATDYSLFRAKARCYRMLQEYDKAEVEIQVALRFRSFNAVNNYEAALLYFDMGDDEIGLEYLEKAVDIWKDADSDYEKANLAKEKLLSLK